MARKVTVSFVDDIDGSNADATVAFTIDGRSYEVDLSAANAAKLRDAFAPFIRAARRAGGTNTRMPRRRVGTSAVDREHSHAVREWAQATGMKVAARGRIPGTVLAAYRTRDETPAADGQPDVVRKKPRRAAKAKTALTRPTASGQGPGPV